MLVSLGPLDRIESTSQQVNARGHLLHTHISTVDLRYVVQIERGEGTDHDGPGHYRWNAAMAKCNGIVPNIHLKVD